MLNDSSSETDVLIAGAGPVGLTAAVELARRGIRCRIVDPLSRPKHYAKAAGVQPRTLEVFEGMGIVNRVFDASIQMRGQIAYINGAPAVQHELSLPDDIPYKFISTPQYALERILIEELTCLHTPLERGVQLKGFQQDEGGVTAQLYREGCESQVRARYLIGADGAHSFVRKSLGLAFEGGAFEEQYMLGDVELDWSLPQGYAIRVIRPGDVLVCIPLPSELEPDRGIRYRISMLAPEELRSKAVPGDDDAHGFGRSEPELEHIQAVLDRLSPEPTRARNLRWSSVFRVSHRIAARYQQGRVFIAGDAAHIHPPTGAQGMNTGIQDAHNLAWKLALAIKGVAANGLLESYEAERRPVGEEVVGRTVRAAREGMGSDLRDLSEAIRREAQLLVNYRESPIVSGEVPPQAVRPGDRAPDARGLARDTVAGPLRLFTLLDRRKHTCILYAGESVNGRALAQIEAAARVAIEAAHDLMDVMLVIANGAGTADTALPLVRDAGGEFASAYSASDGTVLILRPDGYVGYRSGQPCADELRAFLSRTFR